MKFVAPAVILILFSYFLFSGVKNLQFAKLASDTSTPDKNYLTGTGVAQVVLATTVLLVSVFTFRNEGDLSSFFRTIHRFLNPM